MALSAAGRRAKVLRYLDLCSSRSTDQIMELFGPDPVVEDPVGAGPMRGREAVRAFYASAEGTEGVRFELREFRAAGDYAAAFAFDAFTSSRAMHQSFGLARTADVEVRISLIEVMTFDNDGLVVDVKAYWSPDYDMTLAG